MDYGPDVNRYIAAAYPILCANSIPVIIEIAKWADRYLVSYCTQLEHDPYIGRLSELFLQEGIPCTCAQEEDFEEAFADF